MATTISGVSVATPEDIQRLQSDLREVAKRIDRTTRDIDLRLDNTVREVRGIRTDLEAQAARIHALEENVNLLDMMLDDIAVQVSRSGRLLENVNNHAAAGTTVLQEIVDAIRQEAIKETSRRQEFMGKLTQLLAEHKAEASALHQVFEVIEASLDRVADTERKGAEDVRSVINMLHDTVAVVQSQSQAQFDGVTEALRQVIQNRQEQAQDEASAFAQIHATQAVWNERLDVIQASVGNIALSSQRSQTAQDVRLAQLRAARSRALNEEAIRSFMRGEYVGSAALLEETTISPPSNPVLQCNLAMASLKNQDVERARALLEQARELNEVALPVLRSHGLFCIEQGNYGSAVPFLEQVVEAQPDDALSWMNLGNAHFGAGAVLLAIQAWQRAQYLAPSLVSSDATVSIILDEQRHAEV